MNIAILFTGIIENDYLDEFIESYKDCNYTKIISTWDYIDTNIINKLKENNYIVIQTSFPDNIRKVSVNFQTWSTKIGVDYAKNNGFTHILKIRCDIVINDINRFVEIYEQIYEEDKFIILFHSNHFINITYIADTILFGNIKCMELWCSYFQDENDNKCPEHFKQYTTFGIDDIEKDYKKVFEKIIFSIMYLLNENIDLKFISERHREDEKNNLKKWHIYNIENDNKIYYYIDSKKLQDITNKRKLT